MTVGCVTLTLLKIPELWLKARFTVQVSLSYAKHLNSMKGQLAGPLSLRP